MLALPSEQELLTQIYNRFTTETGVEVDLDTSMLGVLFRITANVMSDWFDQLGQLALDSNLATATGEALDRLALTYGVIRKASSTATSLGGTQAVQVTNVGNVSITLPPNTKFWSNSNDEAVYVLVGTATIGAGQSLGIHVRAEGSGPNYNVGIGEITLHNAPTASLRVYNNLPISNGDYEESDESFRQRIIQEASRRYVLNSSNLDAMLRGVPGVRDVYILEKERGAGTFDAVVVPYNYSGTTEVIERCRQLVATNIPVGLDGLVRPPTYKQLDIRISLRLSSNPSSDPEVIRQSIKSLIQNRVDALPAENGTGIGTLYTSQFQASTFLSNDVVDAQIQIGLDGSPVSNNAIIRLQKGERLIVRNLVVE